MGNNNQKSTAEEEHQQMHLDFIEIHAPTLYQGGAVVIIVLIAVAVLACVIYRINRKCNPRRPAPPDIQMLPMSAHAMAMPPMLPPMLSSGIYPMQQWSSAVPQLTWTPPQTPPAVLQATQRPHFPTMAASCEGISASHAQSSPANRFEELNDEEAATPQPQPPSVVRAINRMRRSLAGDERMKMKRETEE